MLNQKNRMWAHVYLNFTPYIFYLHVIPKNVRFHYEPTFVDSIFPEVSPLTEVYGLIVGNTLGNPLDPEIGTFFLLMSHGKSKRFGIWP